MAALLLVGFIAFVVLFIAVVVLVIYLKEKDGKKKNGDDDGDDNDTGDGDDNDTGDGDDNDTGDNDTEDSTDSSEIPDEPISSADSTVLLAEYRKYYKMELEMFQKHERLRLDKTHGVRKNQISKSHRSRIDSDNRKAYLETILNLRDEYIKKIKALSVNSADKSDAISAVEREATENLNVMNIKNTESFDADVDGSNLAQYQKYYTRQLNLFKERETLRLKKTHGGRKKISSKHRATLDKNNRNAYQEAIENLRDSYIDKLMVINFDDKMGTVRDYRQWANDNMKAMHINITESFTVTGPPSYQYAGCKFSSIFSNY